MGTKQEAVKTIQADLRQTKPHEAHCDQPRQDGGGFSHPSNATLAGVLDSVSDGFIAIDGEWRMTYVNKAGLELLGEKAYRVRNFWETYPELVGGPLEQAYRKAASDGISAELEHHQKSRDCWFEIRVYPAHGSGISVFFRDITERKRSADQLKNFRSQLETQVEDLRRLHELNSRLTNSATVSEMLKQVLDAALQLHKTRKGTIALTTTDGVSLQLACSVGFDSTFLERVKSVPCGLGASGLAMRQKKSVTVEDAETDPCFVADRDMVKLGSFRSVHSTPLITPQGRFIGVLSVHFTEQHRPNERQIQLTTMYAQKAADLLESALVREKVERENRERTRTAEQMRDLKLALETQVADLRNLQELNRLNEDRFRMAACGDNITLYEQDADLRYTWLYPLQPDHVPALGRSDSEIIQGPQGQLLELWKREVMRTGVPQRREITAPLNFGTKSYDISIIPRRDHTRKIIGVAGAALDITARVRAEDQSRQLAAIVECSEDAIVSEDLAGTITSWNKAAERIFGYSAAELVGKSISTLIPGQTTGEQIELMTKVLNGERIDCFET
ncbi:MAG: multi-sensor hybrid histidine kinase, partial [Verrucomicrobiales bacterium]|nr:multi-sensor hybrid histidine kinase [Verrucomicrobiales bacterium]